MDALSWHLGTRLSRSAIRLASRAGTPSLAEDGLSPTGRGHIMPSPDGLPYFIAGSVLTNSKKAPFQGVNSEVGDLTIRAFVGPCQS